MPVPVEGGEAAGRGVHAGLVTALNVEVGALEVPLRGLLSDRWFTEIQGSTDPGNALNQGTREILVNL